MPQITVKTSSPRSATMCWRSQPGRRFICDPLLAKAWDELDDEVDGLDPDERDDQPADAVDPQVPAEQRRGGGRPVAHAAQRQRDQRDDDQRVEDDRRGDRRLRAVQVQDAQLGQARERGGEHGRQHREVLGHVVRDGERGQRPAGDQQLLADLHNLDELGRVGVRSAMFPASLAAEVPVFMATPTSAWASAGASLVPSPVIATSLPPSCSLRISAILSSGVASARKSSTPDSSAMALAVSGLSPVIMTVRMPILRISANRSEIPSLTMSFRWITPNARAVPPAGLSATTSGVPPAAEMPSTIGPRSSGGEPPLARTHSRTALEAPLRTSRPSARLTPLIRVCAVNSTNSAPASSPGARSRRPYWFLASTTIERPSGV